MSPLCKQGVKDDYTTNSVLKADMSYTPESVEKVHQSSFSVWQLLGKSLSEVGEPKGVPFQPFIWNVFFGLILKLSGHWITTRYSQDTEVILGAQQGIDDYLTESFWCLFTQATQKSRLLNNIFVGQH